MSLFLFLVFGLVVGLMARALMPGEQNMGVVMTTILGVLGSFLGGLLVGLFNDAEPLRVHAAGLLGSIAGALILLALGKVTYRGRGRAYP
ncbi:MAG TPA: GlsB/YeaQ/YmgE family stress response membrane protein [Polyangiaceae bacterium]|jgi:uncharacterized membrane protein YeaQ/YmgE (transglycosylase-associated protein family)|nr:GlsB/YeaQ/YmgE family stress response membrane protein [Polyangiaceae bacterium]